MSQTVIRGTQILNNTVQRQDLDTSTVGQAVVTKLVQGSGITLSSTGADAGTGDVTVNGAISSDASSDGKIYARLNATWTPELWTRTTAPFTMPGYGAQVTISVGDTSWMNGGMVLNVGVGAAMELMTLVTIVSGTSITVSNFAGSTSSGTIASGTAIWFNASGIAAINVPGILKALSGNTTDFIDGTNNSQPLQPVIWSVRLRTFQALSNNTFEIDQRTAGTAITNPGNGSFVQDRWSVAKSATLTGTVNTALQDASTAPIVIPGTNFGITSKFQRFTVGTAQASLAAGDYWLLQQSVEGPRWRELASDVHSVSLLVRSSVAGLKFSVSLQDSPVVHSLVSQCTISAANTWTLLQLPNLVNWSGNFSAAAGQIAYFWRIVLAAGTTFTAGASSAWQTANILGVTGNSNFLATAGATLDIAYAGHEPGALCTTPIDCPFQQAYDDALRFYQKSYPYTIAAGTVNGAGCPVFYLPASSQPWVPIRFHRPMAKIPTIVGYSNATGAINNVRNLTGSADLAISGSQNVGETGFSGFGLTPAPPATTWTVQFHYTSDTGW